MSQRTQASIYDALGCIVIRLDAQLKVWYVNSFGLRLLGYSRLGQVFQRSMPSLVDRDSAQATEFLAQLEDIGAHGVVRQIESPLRTAAGRRLWVSWTIEHRADTDMLLAPIFLVGADITRLHESIESSQLFRDIAQSNPLGIVITDADLSIRFANPAALAMSGYAAEEVIGNQPRMFRSGLTPDETYRAMWAALNSGSGWSGEFINRHKDGSTYVEKIQISPIPDREGVIRFYFSIAEDQSRQREFEQRLATLTSTDLLTGLPNRAGFLDLAALSMRSAAQNGHGLAVVDLDIDDFEAVNRRLGSDLADRLLIELGRRLTDSVRETDVVARLGSDEFGLLLAIPEAPSASDLTEVSNRLLTAIRPPFALGQQAIEVTASIGIACAPADGSDIGELLTLAAAAAQTAKRGGGDSFIRFDPALARVDSGRHALLGELRHAAARNELVLHYQPQLSLQTGAMVGLEALVRWQHPEHGLLPPGRFIAAAEESGHIVSIGEWVLREACRQMRRWLDAGFAPIKVAVNLSARQFRLSNLTLSISEALAGNGLQAPMLELEITEGAMMHDVAAAIRTSERLKELGVRLSLDDFGTGYSSLAYLSRFPIDVVKIDQSFVRDITTNPSNAAIAQATIAMSHKLGKITLAEGIESEEQMYYLRRNDCDEMQGYYFSRPLPADEIATLRAGECRLHFRATDHGEQLPTVLLVDDEPSILSALNRLLRREGYRVLTAETGDAALGILARETVKVIVSDQRMPTMTGTDLLARVRTLYPETVRMVLSGHSEIQAVTDAINRGAVYKYLNKPWDDETLKTEVRAALRHWNERFGNASQAIPR
ncbi:MAG: EAL domain-containing protein [Candidatus Accumulibacter sp.]|uniref:EAL domain-containing protein n=1 Tax=Accumulibacter sp. TaxID=2053492 RepID=UPI00258F3480|nr:EAL domain-containing protein [Accumulibacter sp.]MBK8115418.1 EAL domain-containing protein [Accumulibacter sp.]